MENLQKHVETIQSFGVPFVIAINKFITDTDAEVAYLQEWCNERGYAVSLTEVWEKGGQGGVDLAEKVLKEIEKGENNYAPLYELELPLEENSYNCSKSVRRKRH